MQTLAELEAKWLRRLEEWRSLGVSVSGERIAAEILADVRAVGSAEAEKIMTIAEAAAITHYHPESIARLVRTGKVKNYGTKHRPRVRLSDLPTKPAAPTSEIPVAEPRRSAASSAAVASIDSLARDAVAGRIGRGA